MYFPQYQNSLSILVLVQESMPYPLEKQSEEAERLQERRLPGER